MGYNWSELSSVPSPKEEGLPSPATPQPHTKESVTKKSVDKVATEKISADPTEILGGGAALADKSIKQQKESSIPEVVPVSTGGLVVLSSGLKREKANKTILKPLSDEERAERAAEYARMGTVLPEQAPVRKRGEGLSEEDFLGVTNLTSEDPSDDDMVRFGGEDTLEALDFLKRQSTATDLYNDLVRLPSGKTHTITVEFTKEGSPTQVRTYNYKYESLGAIPEGLGDYVEEWNTRHTTVDEIMKFYDTLPEGYQVNLKVEGELLTAPSPKDRPIESVLERATMKQALNTFLLELEDNNAITLRFLQKDGTQIRGKKEFAYDIRDRVALIDKIIEEVESLPKDTVVQLESKKEGMAIADFGKFTGIQGMVMAPLAGLEPAKKYHMCYQASASNSKKREFIEFDYMDGKASNVKVGGNHYVEEVDRPTLAKIISVECQNRSMDRIDCPWFVAGDRLSAMKKFESLGPKSPYFHTAGVSFTALGEVPAGTWFARPSSTGKKDVTVIYKGAEKWESFRLSDRGRLAGFVNQPYFSWNKGIKKQDAE